MNIERINVEVNVKGEWLIAHAGVTMPEALTWESEAARHGERARIVVNGVVRAPEECRC